MGESGDTGKVKVVDRRWFTAEGELREPSKSNAAEPLAEAKPNDAAAPAPAAPAPAAPAPAAPAPATEAPVSEFAGAPPKQVDTPTATEPPLPERGDPGVLPAGPGLADIVDLLAQQAMAFMSGQVPGRGRDPATARYFIDLLGVLKEKTAGRLTLEETTFLDDVLYQLRSLYVAATR